MIKSLQINNYILIDELLVDFNSGFTTITGETGAGKSIILGALSLICGSRADQNQIKNKDKKCIVEGTFLLPKYFNLTFFENNNIDYFNETIIRREVLPGGNSRAFINDTPVNLMLLKELGNALIDIHSQHENLFLANNQFQLAIVDSLAVNDSLLQEYVKLFQVFKNYKSQIDELSEKAKQSKQELDYISFQWNQLIEAQISEGEVGELEDERKLLENAEEILKSLQLISSIFDNESYSVLPQVKQSLQTLTNISSYLSDASEWHQRLQSCYVEIREIEREVSDKLQHIEVNPQRLNFITERIDLLYSLLHKHGLKTDNELLQLQHDLEIKIATIQGFDDEIIALGQLKNQTEEELTQLANELTKKRLKIIPEFEGQLKAMLLELGIASANFKVELKPMQDFGISGKDAIQFLFSANVESPLTDISKVASGGEMARIMLCLKSLMASSKQIPTLIFDEIDTGLSGEIAHKMSLLMLEMAKNTQIIAITHLPQIAARGNEHMQVYKTQSENSTLTGIKKLNKQERIEVLARMLSGKQITDAALKNAKDLLKMD